MDLIDKWLAGALGIVLVILGVTFFFLIKPAVSIAGNVAIPTKSAFVVYSDGEVADATLHLETTKIIPAGAKFDLAMRDNQLSERPADRTARAEAGLTATEIRVRPLIHTFDFPFDLGTFGGYAPSAAQANGSTDRAFQVGLRASPFRVLYGIIAPDLLISPDHAGVGVSIFAPPDLLGHDWAHWGVGYGHLWPSGHGGASALYYLSFSTQVP